METGMYPKTKRVSRLSEMWEQRSMAASILKAQQRFFLLFCRKYQNLVIYANF